MIVHLLVLLRESVLSLHLSVLWQCICWYCCVSLYCPFTCLYSIMTVHLLVLLRESVLSLHLSIHYDPWGPALYPVQLGAVGRHKFIRVWETIWFGFHSSTMLFCIQLRYQRKVHAHYILFVLKLNFVTLIPPPCRTPCAFKTQLNKVSSFGGSDFLVVYTHCTSTCDSLKRVLSHYRSFPCVH